MPTKTSTHRVQKMRKIAAHKMKVKKKYIKRFDKNKSIGLDVKRE